MGWLAFTILTRDCNRDELKLGLVSLNDFVGIPGIALWLMEECVMGLPTVANPAPERGLTVRYLVTRLETVMTQPLLLTQFVSAQMWN